MPTRKKGDLRAAAARRDDGVPAAGVTAIRSAPIRITADLEPGLYGEVGIWVAQTAADLRKHVALVDVVRVLLAEIITDEHLAAAVRQRLADQ